MKRVLGFLKSLRLTIVLIALIALGSVLATLVPQGLGSDGYVMRYGRLMGGIVSGSGLSLYFRSLLFLGPALLFFVNLSVCTADRLVRELRKKERRSHGPDILHVGLVLLVAGSILSFRGRQEGSVSLAEGDSVELPGGYVLRLDDFEYLAYEDGRPRDWISRVSILRGGKTEAEGLELRVNHPLKLGRLRLYQFSHSTEVALALRDGSGRERLLAAGDRIEEGGSVLFLMSLDEGSGKALLNLETGEGSKVLSAGEGETAGSFSVLGLREIELSGIRAVSDPGYGLVVAALLLASAGIFITFLQKTGNTKR